MTLDCDTGSASSISASRLTPVHSSGIGRSVAILMAREGADVSIVYLPDEQQDAESTKKAVEAEKQSCILIPGNLMDNKTCQDAVNTHVKKYASPWLSHDIR